MALPANDDDLETTYSAQDVLDVAIVDTARVTQTATAQYAIHEYKDFAEGTNECYIQWVGQTSSNTNPVVLQIYNQVSTTWETIDQMPAAYNSTLDTYSGQYAFYGAQAVNTDFTLRASIADLTNYKNPQGVISCRVYQLE